MDPTTEIGNPSDYPDSPGNLCLVFDGFGNQVLPESLKDLTFPRHPKEAPVSGQSIPVPDPPSDSKAEGPGE